MYYVYRKRAYNSSNVIQYYMVIFITMKQQKQEFVISFRCNAIDMKLVQEIAQALEVSHTDVLKMALWDYASSPKSNLLRESLKELARQQKVSFNIAVLKELEFINNRRAFFVDGFRTSLDNYHKKHVPMPFVKQFILIKLVGLYSVLSSSDRAAYLNYIRQHFAYCYPTERKWLEVKIKEIRRMKKDEKDKLLVKLQQKLNVARDVPKVPQVGASVQRRDEPALYALPVKGGETDVPEMESKE